MPTLKEIKERIKELQAMIDDYKQAPETGRAKEGEQYYFLDSVGRDCGAVESDNLVDEDRWLRGNYYLTRKDASRANDRQLAKMRIIRKYREMETDRVDWGDDKQFKHHVYYGHVSERVSVSYCSYCQPFEPELYTTSKEAAEYVRDNMSDDVKLMLGIE